MKRFTITVFLSLLFAVFVSLLLTSKAAAQSPSSNVSETTSADIRQGATSSKDEGDITLESGTRLTGQLQNTLDARRAKQGDPVVLKTTEPIKSGGKVIVKRGAKLIGHVTEVRQKSKTDTSSSIGVVFDRLESEALTTPISATVTSVIQVAARTSLDEDSFTSATGVPASGRAGSGARSSGGGLLGGVTQTVGGVLDTTTQSVGGVVQSTTGTVGGATGAVASTLKGIQITPSGSASAEGGSTLSLSGDNLRVEKGASFLLTLNEAVSLGKDRKRRAN